jgi:hypothetical protein
MSKKILENFKRLKTPHLRTLMLIFLIAACGGGSSPIPALTPKTDEGPNYVLYTEGMFDSSESKYSLVQKNEYSEKIAASGFTTVIHAFLHVYPDGSLVMNDTKLVYADGSINLDIIYMKDLYVKIKEGGRVKILLALGGGWGAADITSQSDHDYSRILNSMAVYPHHATNPIFKNLLIAKKYFGFDGIDLDFEPYNEDYAAYDETYINLLADITKWATANGMIVTYGVYQEDSKFWGPLLEKTVGANGKQLVSWMNLQGYGGADYGTWITNLEKFDTGIPNMERFISMGYSCHDTASSKTAKEAHDDLITIRNSHSGINSAFVWQYTDIVDGLTTDTVEAYADAIAKGIAGTPYP